MFTNTTYKQRFTSNRCTNTKPPYFSASTPRGVRVQRNNRPGNDCRRFPTKPFGRTSHHGNRRRRCYGRDPPCTARDHGPSPERARRRIGHGDAFFVIFASTDSGRLTPTVRVAVTELLVRNDNDESNLTNAPFPIPLERYSRHVSGDSLTVSERSICTDATTVDNQSDISTGGNSL